MVDLRKRALSEVYGGGPSVAQKFDFGRPKTNLGGFKKWEKKGPLHLTQLIEALCPSCLRDFSFFFGWGTGFLGGGTETNILQGGGGCQQLLTLLTL